MCKTIHQQQLPRHKYPNLVFEKIMFNNSSYHLLELAWFKELNICKHLFYHLIYEQQKMHDRLLGNCKEKKNLFIIFDPHNTTTILLLHYLSKSITKHEKGQIDKIKIEMWKKDFFQNTKQKIALLHR
jgi:hypothetical protein